MRAALRISFRSVRRHPWRSLVVVALVALPVGVLAGALSTMAGNDARQAGAIRTDLLGGQFVHRFSPSAAEPFGPSSSETAADVRGRLSLPDNARIDRQVTGWYALARPNGDVQVPTWSEADWSTLDTGGLVRLADGRWPTRPGEAAVADDASTIGSTIDLTLPELTVTVVGHVQPDDRLPMTHGLIAAPGTFPAVDAPIWSEAGLQTPDVAWVVRGLDRTQLERLGQIEPSYATSSALEQVASVGISTFGFLWCGLVAASALAIGARRRRRELGLLSVNGATPRQLRLSVVADGVVLGGIGAAVGVVAGLVAASWWNDVGLEWTGRTAGGGIAFTPAVVAAPVMGWLSAVLAGGLAGRGVSAQPTVDLLAGRSVRPRGAPRWIGIGMLAAVAAVILGLLITAIGPGRSNGQTVLAVLTVIAGVIALIAISVGSIRLLPAWTASRGVAMRTAARDLARFGARTTGATAAIAITLSAATYGSVGERLNAQWLAEDAASSGVEPFNLAVVGAAGQAIVDGRLVERGLNTAEITRLRTRAQVDGFDVDLFRQTTGGSVRACLDDADRVEAEVGMPMFDDAGCVVVAAVLVPDGEVRNFGESVRSALARGEMVGYSTFSQVGATSGARLSVRGDDVSPITVVDRDLLYRGSGGSPFSEALITGLGGQLATVLVPESAWTPTLERTSIELATVSDRTDLNGEAWWKRVDSLGLSVRGSYGSDVAIRWDATAIWGVGAAIVVVCLAVLTLALVLVRIESQDEENVMVTQGAPRAVIAGVCGWRAALVTLTAAVPAVALTLAFLWIVRGEVVVPHPVSLVMLLLGLPVLAGLVFGAGGLHRLSAPVTTA